jgi:hypothetical protein
MFGEVTIRYPQAVLDALSDPITLEPYKNAQIVNCSGGHSFSLTAVQNIFGEMQENNSCEKPAPCPLCRGMVTAYHMNTTLQALVDPILVTQTDESHKITLKSKVEPNGEILYPIQKTFFVLQNTIFIETYLNITLSHRSCGYQDENIETLTADIEIGHDGLRFLLNIFFHKNQHEVKSKLCDYLKKNNINSIQIMNHEYNPQLAMGCYPGYGFRKTSSFNEFISCLRLLIENNDFDATAKDGVVKFLERCEKLTTQIRV